MEVWGYSLPQSDTAVRSLLNCLRFRLAQSNGGIRVHLVRSLLNRLRFRVTQRKVRVRVHDPVREVRDRWQEFLGETAETDDALL